MGVERSPELGLNGNATVGSESMGVSAYPCAGDPRIGTTPGHSYAVLGSTGDTDLIEVTWMDLTTATLTYPVLRIAPKTNASDTLCPPCEAALHDEMQRLFDTMG